MTIDDIIKREDVVKLIVKQEELMDKYSEVHDYIGHQMHLCADYTSKELQETFDITKREIADYRKQKNNYDSQNMLPFEEHFVYDT